MVGAMCSCFGSRTALLTSVRSLGSRLNASSDAGVSSRIPLSQALTSRKGPLTAKYKSKGLSAFGQLPGETRQGRSAGGCFKIANLSPTFQPTPPLQKKNFNCKFISASSTLPILFPLPLRPPFLSVSPNTHYLSDCCG